MRSLLALSRGIDTLNRWVGKGVGWLILIVVVISASNAIFRKLFGLSSNAWLEVQWYFFGAIFLLGAGYTLLNNQHVRVDVLVGHRPERTQLKLEVIGTLCFLLPVCVVILWLSWPMALESYFTGEMSSNSGGLIRWPAKMLIPVGFSLLTLAAVSHLIKCVGFLLGVCPNPLKRIDSKTPEELLAEEIARNAAKQQEQK